MNPGNAGIHCLILVCHLWLEFLGLVDHLLNLAHGRHTVADVLSGVGLLQFRLQVLCHAMTELLHGVNTSGLEQLGELRSYTVDAEQVGMVGPLQDEFLADASLLCQGLTSLRGSTLLEQFTPIPSMSIIL